MEKLFLVKDEVEVEVVVVSKRERGRVEELGVCFSLHQNFNLKKPAYTYTYTFTTCTLQIPSNFRFHPEFFLSKC